MACAARATLNEFTPPPHSVGPSLPPSPPSSPSPLPNKIAFVYPHYTLFVALLSIRYSVAMTTKARIEKCGVFLSFARAICAPPVVPQRRRVLVCVSWLHPMCALFNGAHTFSAAEKGTIIVVSTEYCARCVTQTGRKHFGIWSGCTFAAVMLSCDPRANAKRLCRNSVPCSSWNVLGAFSTQFDW